jgi:hypothetical protein
LLELGFALTAPLQLREALLVTRGGGGSRLDIEDALIQLGFPLTRPLALVNVRLRTRRRPLKLGEALLKLGLALTAIL